VNIYIQIGIWAVIIGVVFAILWSQGQVARFADYVRETREELRKCTWPTWEELKGSTALIVVSIVLLGGFTVVVDLFCNFLVRLMT